MASATEVNAMTQVSEPLRRMATVIDAVGSSPQGLSSTLVAELTGLPMPTVHRTLRNLVAIGYIENDGQGTPYRLGSRLLRLVQPGLREEDIGEIAEPILQRMADSLGCTAYLARQAGHSVGSTVAEVLPKVRGRAVILAGHDLPLHATASGKVFLATFSEGELTSFLREKLEACRPATITDPEELRRHLAQVRQRGYAMCKDECDPGVYAVAAPVHLVRQGLHFAAGAVGLRQTLFGKMDERDAISLVKDVAQELTARLNGVVRSSTTTSAIEVPKARRTARTR